MCNLYSVTSNQAALRTWAGVMAENDHTGNLPPLPGVFPDGFAPIVRNGRQGRELVMARWGMPTPPWALLKGKPKGTDPRTLRDPGTTNIRNTKLSHWRRWLGRENRCVVPFNSFAEPEGQGGPPIWFAANETRPLAWFAGIWIPKWTSIRKVKEGATTNDLYGFLTTDPNKLIGQYHPRAMPAILTTLAEVDQWMSEPIDEALGLQRPLPDNALVIVARGSKKDGAELAA
jgi:putative SOS response-associated peptidase YedK